jgi:hypothetical protein
MRSGEQGLDGVIWDTGAAPSSAAVLQHVPPWFERFLAALKQSRSDAARRELVRFAHLASGPAAFPLARGEVDGSRARRSIVSWWT